MQAVYSCYDEPPECYPNREIPEIEAEDDVVDFLTRKAPEEFRTMVAGVRETVVAFSPRR